jgi:hypothetical protein
LTDIFSPFKHGLVSTCQPDDLIKYKNELTLMHFIDISNKFRLILYFIEMIYIIIYFNSTVNFCYLILTHIYIHHRLIIYGCR